MDPCRKYYASILKNVVSQALRIFVRFENVSKPGLVRFQKFNLYKFPSIRFCDKTKLLFIYLLCKTKLMFILLQHDLNYSVKVLSTHFGVVSCFIPQSFVQRCTPFYILFYLLSVTYTHSSSHCLFKRNFSRSNNNNNRQRQIIYQELHVHTCWHKHSF